MVRLWVQAPGETDFDDNTVPELKLCPNTPAPAAQSGGISPIALTELEAGPAAGRQVIDAVAHLLPGKHTLELEPSVRRSMSRNTSRDSFMRSLEYSSHPDELFVGWDGSGQYHFRVSQTAVNFDLAKLLEVEKPSIEEAHLSFVEHPIDWGGDVRERADLRGCVAELGIATNDWTVPPRQFISSELLFRDRHLTFKLLPHTLTTGELSSGQRWRAFVVTDHVQNYMLPDDTALRFGYVLHGAVEDDRHPPSGGACMSRIAAIRLWVTYVVESG